MALNYAFAYTIPDDKKRHTDEIHTARRAYIAQHSAGYMTLHFLPIIVHELGTL
jgi:hypothetical protein